MQSLGRESARKLTNLFSGSAHDFAAVSSILFMRANSHQGAL
jgi:hypothetical protein